MPLVCESRRVLAAAVPNAVLVEDRADTPDFTLVLLLHGASFGHMDVIRQNVVWFLQEAVVGDSVLERVEPQRKGRQDKNKNKENEK